MTRSALFAAVAFSVVAPCAAIGCGSPPPADDNPTPATSSGSSGASGSSSSSGSSGSSGASGSSSSAGASGSSSSSGASGSSGTPLPAGLVATPGAYALPGSCAFAGGAPVLSTLTVVVTTQPDGTLPSVVLHAFTPLPEQSGIFRMPLAGNLTELGGTVTQWYFTEVGGIVKKNGTVIQRRVGPLNYALDLRASLDIGGGPNVMICSYAFVEPFVVPAPAPRALPTATALSAVGACSVIFDEQSSCAPGMPNRDNNGCCPVRTELYPRDGIAFRVDATGGTRSLKVLQAPTNAPNVSNLVVEEAASAFDRRPALYATTTQRAFTIATMHETSTNNGRCGLSRVKRTCNLVYAP